LNREQVVAYLKSERDRLDRAIDALERELPTSSGQIGRKAQTKGRRQPRIDTAKDRGPKPILFAF